MYSFTKSQRLLKKSDYDAVFKKAKKIGSISFTLLCHTNMLGHARLGLIIPKRTVNKAHNRNRIKRLIREQFRLKENLPAFDIIVLAKNGADKIEQSLLIDQLETIWNKLSVLRA